MENVLYKDAYNKIGFLNGSLKAVFCAYPTISFLIFLKKWDQCKQPK